MVSQEVLTRVRKTVEQYQLFEGNERVLVAFSGGPDSVFLLEALLSLKEDFNLTLAIAHFHHGLRGEDADLDLEFSRRKAKEIDVEFFWGRRELGVELERRGGGLETLARKYRFEFLLDTLRKWKGDLIATGHTLTDSMETCLFNILRGTGVAGLSGIPPKRGVWVRPLIEVTKEEIMEYLRTKNLEYRVDKTNLEPVTPRNYLRLKVFPLLREKFPGYERNWANTLRILRDVRVILDLKINEEIKRLKKLAPHGALLLNRYEFLRLPVALKRAIINKLFGVSFRETEELLLLIKKGGKRKLPGGEWLEASFGDIFVTREFPQFLREIELSFGDTTIEELNMVVNIAESSEVKPQDEKFVAVFSRDEVSFPLKVRRKKEGDRILFGNRAKKLKEIFIESRVPRWRRDLVLIVEDKKGILWVPGLLKREGKSRSKSYLIISIRRLSDEKFWVYDS